MSKDKTFNQAKKKVFEYTYWCYITHNPPVEADYIHRGNSVCTKHFKELDKLKSTDEVEFVYKSYKDNGKNK